MKALRTPEDRFEHLPDFLQLSAHFLSSEIDGRAQESLRHRDEMVVAQKAPLRREDQDQDDDAHGERHGDGIGLAEGS